MKFMILSWSLIASMVVLSGCNGDSTNYVAAGFYDFYGNLCSTSSPYPGCTYTDIGSKIYITQDPYWAFAPMDGSQWQSPDGVIYFGLYAINSDSSGGSRDMMGDIANQHQDLIQAAGTSFAAKYALSEETGVRIARALMNFVDLGNQRARTLADIQAFNQNMYGISLDQTVAALNQAQQGDLSGIQAANSQVAAYWGTNPETSSTILKNWFHDQMGSYGLKN